MFRTAVGRRRRALWAILSCLFAVGFAVSAFMVHSEGNQALESVIERGRDEAQIATATLSGKELTKPITGSAYGRVAAKIRKSVSSEGSITDVTIWSSRGRIIFALNESRVGKTPPEMQSLITAIANGSDSTRVLGGTVQTFTRISKASSVAIVQVDQPAALVEPETGGPWSTVRLGSAVGLTVCLLLLGLTFVPWTGTAGVPEDAEPAQPDRGHEPDEAHEADESKAERQPRVEPPPADHRATYAELFGLESDLHAHAGIPDRAPDEADRPGDEEVGIEAQGQPSAQPMPAEQHPAQQPPAQQLPPEQPPAEQPPAQPLPVEPPAEERAPSSEEDVHAPQADHDEAMAQFGALNADGDSPDSMDESIAGQWPEEFRDVFRDMARGGGAPTQEMRQRREEFKNRARQAELRLKKQDEELDEAPSSPSSER
jgi:hypothetical protein